MQIQIMRSYNQDETLKNVSHTKYWEILSQFYISKIICKLKT